MKAFWQDIKNAAQEIIQAEPMMSPTLENAILKFDNFPAALAHRIASKLAFDDMGRAQIESLARKAFQSDQSISQAAMLDILATVHRDPACDSPLEPFMFFKGFMALQTYRVMHYYWQNGQKSLARLLQMRNSEMFGFDVHPAAKIGQGVMFDHAHSIVIGETAVVGNDVSILHSVTLGGTGKAGGDRHPKIEDGVMIGAGAKILGNIRIGKCSRIAAGSVVLKDIPPRKTVAGVPAKVIGDAGCPDALFPSQEMNQTL